MRRLILVFMVVAGLAACSSPTDPYPLPSGPAHAGNRSPAQVGVPLTTVVIFIQIRPGDRIELLGAQPVGVADGATVRFLLSRPLLHADGSTVIGQALVQLEGAEVSAVSASPGPDNTIGIVAELTALHPGRYQLTNVRLRYRLNGGEARVGEGIDVVWTVCADDPAPATCTE